VGDEWAGRVARAERLSAQGDAASPLLAFYTLVLRWQADASASLRRSSLSGAIDRDLPSIRPVVPALLSTVAQHGPALLAAEAARLSDSSTTTLEQTLLTWWDAPSDRQFFPKAILQPYAAALAAAQIAPARRDASIRADGRCPFCAGAPQLSMLTAAGGGDGGGRQLLCARCLTPWPYRRIRCAHCGEEDERKLSYFHSPAFDHLRVDACDACARYLKTVDLTRLGLAVPLVDEVAAATLDVWARERGYEKIELNLVGL